MAYEVIYLDDFDVDLEKARFSLERAVALADKLDQIASDDFPVRKTQPITGYKFRKIRFGYFRVFLHIDHTMMALYILALFHRDKCYKRKNINKTLSRIKKILSGEVD